MSVTISICQLLYISFKCFICYHRALASHYTYDNGKASQRAIIRSSGVGGSQIWNPREFIIPP